MNKDLRLADLLSRHMQEAGIKDARLATLVNQQHPQLRLTRSSVRNWREGTSEKARDWKPIAAIADVFRLDEAQASELLQAASQPPIAQLLAETSNEQDRELLSRWAKGGPTAGKNVINMFGGTILSFVQENRGTISINFYNTPTKE